MQDQFAQTSIGTEEPTVLGPGRWHARRESISIPERIGGFRIIGLLGEGGMGRVYLGEQEHPRRRVALKVVRPGWASASVLRRFDQEVEVLARLRHPGIAQIFEAGVHDEGGQRVPFFAMECVAGQTLTEHASQTGMGLRAKLEMFASVCDAVHHAHTRGVVHRDLKPANIVVGEDGLARVLDFGVAKATDADLHAVTQQTTHGELVGTVPYMSPEQIGGSAERVDARSDVYSLGVVLYELLSGRLPHDVRRTTIARAARVIGEEAPARLSQTDPSYRGDLETIVGKALEKAPGRRYQTAAALASDLRRFVAHEPILARTPSRVRRVRGFVSRRRAVVAGVVAGSMSMMATALVMQWLR